MIIYNVNGDLILVFVCHVTLIVKKSVQPEPYIPEP